MADYRDGARRVPQLSRRRFVQASAVAAALVATGTALSGCKSEPATPEVDAQAEQPEGQPATADNPSKATFERDLADGTWVSAACWHNCGGKCINKVLVKDGMVVRQKTDDTHADSPDFPQQRACLRGYSQQRQVFGDDRIKYPMKRKGWSPDNPQGQLRGRDEWERISWDEALDYVADELRKAYDNYGPESILSFGSAGGVQNVLSSLGGFRTKWDTASLGTFRFDWTKAGMLASGMGTANDRFDLRKAETVVLIGANPAWSCGGIFPYLHLQAKKAGAEYIYVGPYYNATAQMLDAKWIPVMAGTDTAFLCAVAHTLLAKDSEDNPMIDWDFLHKYSVGFDAETMPADATTDENFRGYLLGEYDGVVKDAAWGAKMSGATVEDIEFLAEAIKPGKRVSILHGNAPARNNGAEDFPQAFMTIGLMTGHMGKPGECTGNAYKAQVNAGITLVKAGSKGYPAVKNPVTETICAPVMWKSIKDGRFLSAGPDTKWENRGMVDVDIHVIHTEAASGIQGTPGLRDGLDVYRSVDFAFTQAFTFNTPAKLSDIVLPVATPWECDGGGAISQDREYVIFYQKVVDPMFESHSDQWIAGQLADRLGLSSAELFPFDENQAFFNLLATSTVWDPELKDYAPLCTITDKDIEKWGVAGEPQQGVIAIDELVERGCYQFERKEGDGTDHIAYADFLADPEANPLASASGKFEIYCQWKADTLNALGHSDMEFKPYPTYVKAPVCYEETFEDIDAGKKGDYPFVLYNPHYLRRTHSCLDQVDWLREAWNNPVYLNASDARSLGIEDGDAVLVSNPYGKTVRYASLHESMIPGLVGLPHGAWLDWDDEAELDRGGTDNLMMGPTTSNLGVSGYNNFICAVEKYKGEEQPLDCERKIAAPAGME